jgi:nicotinate-nucleotide adenylyltransferase
VEVALLGGSFNPPHVGHLLAVHYVWATQPVDEVWLLPSYRHPFGKSLAPFEHRLRMCQLLADDASGWLKVCDAESEVPGESWTVDVLEHLRQRHPGHAFTLVIGSDILRELPKWKDAGRIEQLARLLVLHRAGHPSPRAFGPPLAEVSSTEIRDRLIRGDAPVDLVPRRVLEYAREHGLYST